MKEPEYIEGRQATKNFEEAMKALLKVPNGAVVRIEEAQSLLTL
jgi:hypothetical protein